MSNKKDDRILFWSVILAAPIGIVLMKALPHTDFYKDSRNTSHIINKIDIGVKINSSGINFIVNNGSNETIKDLQMKCTYIAKSGTVLQEYEHTIYNVFYKNRVQSVSRLNISKPNQTHSAICEAKKFSLVTK